jgi:hypothetical protein
MVGLDLLGWSLVGLVCNACAHGSWFGYRWDACERDSVLATGVTLVSFWPLVI